jgi:hypothetical protein
MKAILFISFLLVACGQQSKDDTTTNTVSKETTTKSTSTIKAGFHIAATGNANLLAGDSAVDELISRFSAKAIMFNSSDKTTRTIDVGTTMDCPNLVLGYAVSLKKGESASFCKPTVVSDNVAIYRNFTVSFMVVETEVVAVLANDGIYGANEKDGQVLSKLKGVPTVQTESSLAFMKVIYASNDLFPEPFKVWAVEGRDEKGEHVNDSSILRASIDLTSEQREMLWKAGVIGYVVPTAPVVLDVSSEIGKNVSAGSATAPVTTPSTPSTTTPSPASDTPIKLTADSTIPFAEASFTMELNMDEILGDDSNLSGTPATLTVNMVDGVPFGTKMKVEKAN